MYLMNSICSVFMVDKHNLMSITDPMGVAVSRNEYDDDGI